MKKKVLLGKLHYGCSKQFPYICIFHSTYSLEQRLKKTRLPYVGPFAVTLVGCLICIVIRMSFIAVHNFPAVITGGFMGDSPFS
jgi:hypothetical protein